MLTILIVHPNQDRGGQRTMPRPSLEILEACGEEDALEKLGRNRRIDAILLDAGEENPMLAEAIRLDNPAPPPIFTVEGRAKAIPGATSLPGGSLEKTLDALLARLA